MAVPHLDSGADSVAAVGSIMGFIYGEQGKAGAADVL